VALLATADRYVGNAFVTLPGELREAFWRYVEENAAEYSPIKGMRRRGATWVRPGLRAEVRHLRGEETLRHATLQGLHVESEGDRVERGPGAAQQRDQRRRGVAL
jgi:hypothetical protein